MMQGGMMAGSQLMNNAQARNNGQQTGFLGGSGAIDGTSQSLWNAIDPGNISGHSSSGHILSNVIDPGNVFGFNQAANPNGQAGAGNATFPNLGAASMIPQAPGGAFQHIHNGAGTYNNMAATGAGGLAFNPSANAGGPKPSQGSPIGISPQMKHPVAPVNAPRNMGQPDIQNIMARYGNMTGGNK